MGWKRYNAYKRHPFETSTGMEGGCHHCGGPYDAVTHEQPWEAPLPEPEESKDPPGFGELPRPYELLDTATYDEPDRSVKVWGRM